MKTTFLSIAAGLTLMAQAAFAQNTVILNPGDNMPGKDIALMSTEGKKTNLQSAMGDNGVLVMFSCNTCPYVVKNEPVTKSTMQYAAAHKVGMVIINSNEARRDGDDSPAEMKKYARKQRFTVPYLADDNAKLADLFGAGHTPEIFLFDKNGKLVYKGAMNDNPSDPGAATTSYINNAIDAVAAGKTPSPQTTKSIGCSIKRKS